MAASISFLRLGCCRRLMFSNNLLLGKNLQKAFQSSEAAISAEPVIVGKQHGVFTIALNRPEKRNCINTETSKLLVKAFEDFEKDDECHAAVLHGKGGNFCSGMDLEEVSNMKSADDVPKFPEKRGPMGPTRMFVSKPVIAAIDGYAVAGGLELALCCDLRVVEETAVLGIFNRRFGVPLIDGGTVRLQRIIGFSRALDLILTGRRVSGKEAFSIGLADRITETGTAFGIAVSLALSLAKYPRECMLADRRATYYAAFEAKSMEDAFTFEQQNSQHVLIKESVEGAKKFMSGIGKHGKFNLHPLEELLKLH